MLTKIRQQFVNDALVASTAKWRAAWVVATTAALGSTRQFLVASQKVIVSRASLDFLLLLHHRHAIGARLAELIGTTIQLRSAQTVREALTQGVGRLNA